MELLEGRPLDERLSEGPLSPEETMRVVDHVARAIGKAHEVGFVHRDLKPANVFITPNDAEASRLLRAFWVMKVLDFGIAKEVDAAEAEAAGTGEDRADSPSTETGAVVGTPHYMSPEQARGRPVDARSDLWSLGVMTYECLVGERPFRGGSFGGCPTYSEAPSQGPKHLHAPGRQRSDSIADDSAAPGDFGPTTLDRLHVAPRAPPPGLLRDCTVFLVRFPLSARCAAVSRRSRSL